MPPIVKLEQLVTKTDLKTAVVMVKRISLTNEQIQYFTKIKSVPKYASDFPTEIVEQKIRKPCVIQFSKKRKVSEKEHEQVLQENKNLTQEKQDDHESTMLPEKYVMVSPRKSFQELQIPQNEEISEEISEYEKIRLKNIAEQKAMFLNNLKKSALALSTSMTPKQPKQFKPKMFAPNTEPIVRSKRILERRSSAKENQSGDKPITDSGGPEYKELPHKRRKSMPSRWGFNPNINVLQPEDITEEMLANVATPSIGKIRHEDGTTCHQCRIKTMDNKTICRSGKCSGNRGMFCGTCLQNRYGQDARKALKDPNWWCPPCMNVCNCSICRSRIGKGATPYGTTQLAKERGFQSVHHYLKYKHTLIE